MDPRHDPGFEAARELVTDLPPAAEPIRVAEGGLVYVGTASWTDPTMTRAGVFYPREASSAEDRLRYYGSRFSLVEVDSTYYAVPDQEWARAWIERTPPEFRFDVKAHALMTGQPSETRRLPKAVREALPEALAAKARIYARDLPSELLDELWRLFRHAIAPLHESGRLGAILLQYPKWIFPSHESREAILAARERLGGLPIAVEFRHSSWLNEKNAERTASFLRQHSIPYVTVDEPQGFKSSVPPASLVTSEELAVFRFHGRNDETWEQPSLPPAERFRYLYDEDELADWAPQIVAASRRARHVHALFNNCSGNYGATNATQLADLIRQYAAD